ncbi:MAG: efflux RND transporter periplasmic adaptor subunit [Paludibacter sp.]|nr:efflux RND transporter periplasmic adaptor subunit [Paludibacter sp.]
MEKSNFEDVVKIEGYVEPLNSFSVACPRYVDGTISYIIQDGIMVHTGDTVCILEDNSIMEDFNEIKTQLENAEMELVKTQADQALQLSLMEAQVKNNEAETQIANLDSLQLKYNSPTQRKIKELELQKALIEKNKLQKKLKSLATIQKSDIRRKELQIERLKNRLETAQKRIDDMTMTSPTDGMVIRANFYATGKKLQVGDGVWSNMPLVYIPVNNKMKVKINASEANFKRINENDTVEYLFDAMPGNYARGAIIKKSPVGRPVQNNSKVKIFDIEASVDSCKTIPDPGFTCNCKIILKRVKDTIVIPQVALYEKDSMKVVYVVHPKKFEMRQVETGLSSPETVIITKGLKAGEEITLTKPDKEFIKQKTTFKKAVAKDSTQVKKSK